MVQIQQKVLYQAKSTSNITNNNSRTHLEHRNSPWQERPVRLTSPRKRLDAPKRAQAECSFFASDTVFRFTGIVAIYKVLQQDDSDYDREEAMKNERTLEVNPPLSGVLRICLRVDTNLGSD